MENKMESPQVMAWKRRVSKLKEKLDLKILEIAADLVLPTGIFEITTEDPIDDNGYAALANGVIEMIMYRARAKKYGCVVKSCGDCPFRPKSGAFVKCNLIDKLLQPSDMASVDSVPQWCPLKIMPITVTIEPRKMDHNTAPTPLQKPH
jgi:hypothetical protein